jgi:hypothetical protein
LIFRVSLPLFQERKLKIAELFGENEEDNEEKKEEKKDIEENDDKKENKKSPATPPRKSNTRARAVKKLVICLIFLRFPLISMILY